MDVLITSQEEKLPPPVRALLDPAQPLPADAIFFEQKFTLAALLGRLLGGLALLGASVFLAPLAILLLFGSSGAQTTV